MAVGLARTSYDIWVPSRAWHPGHHSLSCVIQTTIQVHQPGSGLAHLLEDLHFRGKREEVSLLPTMFEALAV